MDLAGAQRIDRDGGRQGRIDTAGHAEHDAGEAVLADIVAQAQHHRGIDFGQVGLGRVGRAVGERLRHPFGDVGAGESGRRHRLQPVAAAPEIDRQHRLRPGRHGRDQRAGRIDDEGSAVEHQLVLAADLVQIDHRQAGFHGAFARQFQPLVDLAEFERRAVGDDQQFGARAGQGLGHGGKPDVLADRQAQSQPAKDHRLGQRSGGEDALFVEDAVIGQFVLGADGLDLTVRQQIDRVMDHAVGTHRRRHQQGGAAIGGIGFQAVDRAFDRRQQARPQHQVLRRIADQHQFGKGDQRRAVRRRGRPRGADQRGIAFDIADGRVDLRQRQAEMIGCAGDVMRRNHVCDCP